MQLSQREAERQERRATNLIWNAARDYSLAPVIRAYDTEGFADIYMNSIIGAVYSYYDFPKIKEVLDSFVRTPRGDEFEELAWVALENCAFERAASERPALRELRRKCDSAEISTKALDLRGLMSSVDLMEHGLNALEALRMGVVNKAFDPFERKLVEDVITARIPSALGRDKLFDE